MLAISGQQGVGLGPEGFGQGDFTPLSSVHYEVDRCCERATWIGEAPVAVTRTWCQTPVAM